jgi:hypothetical protein
LRQFSLKTRVDLLRLLLLAVEKGQFVKVLDTVKKEIEFFKKHKLG